MKLKPLGLGIGVVLFFTALFFAIQPEKQENTNPEGSKITPLFLQQLELYQYKDNQETLRVFAQQAQIFEQDELTLLFGVMAKLIEKGEPTKLRSKEARITGKNKFMTLQGEVEIEFGKGSILHTAVLYYDQDTKRLFNRHKTTIVNVNDHIEAESLNYITDHELLTLIKPVITVVEQ